MAKVVELPPVGELRNCVIASLDLGRRTGWACFKGGLEPMMDSGVFELYQPRDPQPDYQPDERFNALYSFLGKLHQATSFTHLAFEMVTFGQKGAQATTWPGYRAIVMMWAQRAGCKVIPMHTGTIKKAFCGNGAAKKEEMIETARRRGYLPFDDNECDAIAVLHAISVLANDSAEYLEALKFAKKYEGLEELKLRPKAKKARVPKKPKAPPRLVGLRKKGARKEQLVS